MEAWDPSLKSNLTYSHPWAASPAYNIPQGMFGIRPTTPGYATFDVRPQPALGRLGARHAADAQGLDRRGVPHRSTAGRMSVSYVPGNTVAPVFVPAGGRRRRTSSTSTAIATPAVVERGYLRVDDVPAGCHVFSLEPGDGPGLDGHLTSVCPDGYTAPDLTAPVVSIATDPATPSGDNGWYTGAVTIAATATDEASGVASLEYGVDDGSWTAHDEPLAAQEGETTYLFRAVDRAGNVSVTESTTIRRDATAPGLAWVGDISDGSNHVFGTVPEAPICEAMDELSGEAGCDVSGYSSAVGTHTLTATARDLAGNRTTETLTYTVTPWTLSGFTSPVDMNGVVNIVKAGSTVPLKFEVFAGDQELTSTEAIDGLRTVETSCRAGAATDEIETTVAGGTEVTYDSDAGLFQYNWKTSKGATECVKLVVGTADGSELSALFRLK